MFALRPKAAEKTRILCRCFSEKPHYLKTLDLPKSIEPQPIQNLKVLANAKKVRKEFSFISTLFLGKFDVDFLTFPEILYGRKDFLALTTQSQMVNKYFRGIVAADSQRQLNEFRFNRLWTLSKAETVSILEAVGESLALKPFDIEEGIKSRDSGVTTSGNNQLHDYLNRLPVHPATNPDVQTLIFDLILQNCITMSAIQQSENEQLREAIKEEFSYNPNLKIGFAWSERTLPLGSLPYPDWESEAKLTPDKSSWLINGKKNRILKQDYDYYLVFCKTQDYPDLMEGKHLTSDDLENDLGVVGVLLRKDQVGKIIDEETENGVSYQSIVFEDILVPRSHYEVSEANPFAVKAQNIRGMGHVATSAFILGQMKTLLNTLYDYLVNERRPIADCELVQKLLADITRKIFAIESVVYMVTAMYDCFDDKQYSHLYLEAAATKVIAVEYAYDIIHKSQMIFGSKVLMTSPFQDLINICDSFLDGSLHNRILIGLQGLKFAGQYKNDHVHKMRLGPFFPMYFFKQMLMKSVKKRFVMKKAFFKYDMKGYLHPSLNDEGDQLEISLRLFEHAVDYGLLKWGKAIGEHQCDVNRLSEMAIDLWMLTCVLARASRAYCDGIRNGDTDIFTATSIIQETSRKFYSLVCELENEGSEVEEFYNEHIHTRNMKYNGYYAFPPTDKVFY